MNKNSHPSASCGGNINHEKMASKACRYGLKNGLIRQPLPEK